MMNESLYMVLAFAAGMGLGTLFFGGLWYTVKKAVDAAIPAIWIFASFFLRISITLIGFYFVAAGNWKKFLVCVAGFIVARTLVIRLTKSMTENQMPIKKGGIS